MALTPEQQAIELITRSKRILIVSRDHAAIDALASVGACLSYLTKMGKAVDAVVQGHDKNRVPAFLPVAASVNSTLGAMRAFELTLDVSKTPLAELLYDVKDGKLNITVTPKSGEWSPQDVSFKHGQDRYDLVIAFDCPDLASLGALFKEHADFFYRTTIVNIDRDPTNEHWGQINLVNLNAVSSSEILFGLFETWNKNLVDEPIATALLAGMISKTQSFRTSNVTPKTLETASKLITMGAKREEIVHGLWRTKSVPTLKLWGRALSRLEQDRALGLVWTTLSRQDFLDSGASDHGLEGIVSELVAYSPEAKVVVVLHEKGNAAQTGACVTIHAMPPYSAAELGRAFGASGARDCVEFCLPPGQPLEEGMKHTIDRLRETLKQTSA